MGKEDGRAPQGVFANRIRFTRRRSIFLLDIAGGGILLKIRSRKESDHPNLGKSTMKKLSFQTIVFGAIFLSMALVL